MNVHESDLAQPLLAYALCFYVVVVLWAEIRRANPNFAGLFNILKEEDKRLVLVMRFYRKLTMAFCTIVLCFALYPLIYQNFIPIRQMDIPVLNIAGIIALVASMVWMVIAQVDFDALFYRNALYQQSMNAQEVVKYSKRILAGFQLMFLGITITLGNLLSVALLLLAMVIYHNRDTIKWRSLSA